MKNSEVNTLLSLLIDFSITVQGDEEISKMIDVIHIVSADYVRRTDKAIKGTPDITLAAAAAME